MKKLLFTGLIGALSLSACSTVQKGQEAQNQRSNFMKLKGTWEVASVNYDKNYKIKPFDEGVDAKCFLGSTWSLVPNNWTGSYTLSGKNGCPAISQPIKFEVVNGNQFQFKKIYSREKAKQNVSGYILEFKNQTDNSFTLVQNVPFEGNYIKVYYEFQKVNQSK